MAKKIRAAARPTSATLRAYNVGFGDCLLLSFRYADGERHVLIDFGSNSPPEGAPPDLLGRVAADIRDRCGGKLHAVVLTHRHKDHIAGFDPGAKDDGPGAVIRDMHPDLVVCPWTEDPDAAADATGPVKELPPDTKYLLALEAMHSTAAGALAESRRLLAGDEQGVWRPLFEAVADESEEGMKNAAAVRNLREMSKNRRYVYHGVQSGLEAVLPGVDVTVLGPPTVKQWKGVQNEARSNKDEFWLRQGAVGDHMARSGGRPLFPRFATGTRPPYARWFVGRMRRIRGEQLLRIVRGMDDAMNNTSVVLLFEAGKAALLFPGDAQIENWEYTIKNPDADAATRAMAKRLEKVTLYKVGHHGSRNATPKTLWNAFARKGPEGTPNRLVTVVSTREGTYPGSKDGKSGTEVPRKTLVEELKRMSDYHTTQDTPEGRLYIEVAIPL
jgi:hypothetical protein